MRLNLAPRATGGDTFRTETNAQIGKFLKGELRAGSLLASYPVAGSRVCVQALSSLLQANPASGTIRGADG